MSGSPKYTSVALSYQRRQAEAAARARRAEQRRQRQAEREAQLRAAEEQRAQRRLAREAEQLNKLLDDARRAAAAQVASASAVVAQAQHDIAAAGATALADQMRALQAEVSALESRVRSAADGTGADLRDYERSAESLRARALTLRASAFQTAGLAGRQLVLDDLRRRFAAVRADVTVLDAAQLARCAEVLDQLEAAAGQAQGVRFEALHGTAEHTVASLERKVADASAPPAPRHRNEADRVRAAKEAAAAQERMDYAAARLAVLSESARSAISDAAAFGAHAVHELLTSAVAAAEAAVAAGAADALAEVDRLATLLPDAEAQLDEAVAAYERRAELAAALREALTGRGLTFAGGQDDADGRFVLAFERPGGAAYTATIGNDASGELTLSYAIEGEPDVAVLLPEGAQATCDRTEAFLESVHDGLAESGFEAGELRWNGKPPRGQARGLPRQRANQEAGQAARWRQHD
jgi:hypothetical protein